MECIFGIRWTGRTDPTVDPRYRRAFRSRPLHVREPPANLQAGLQRSAAYAAYLEVIADFSVSEKRQMLHDTAAEIYGL